MAHRVKEAPLAVSEATFKDDLMNCGVKPRPNLQAAGLLFNFGVILERSCFIKDNLDYSSRPAPNEPPGRCSVF